MSLSGGLLFLLSNLLLLSVDAGVHLYSDEAHYLDVFDEIVNKSWVEPLPLALENECKRGGSLDFQDASEFAAVVVGSGGGSGRVHVADAVAAGCNSTVLCEASVDLCMFCILCI